MRIALAQINCTVGDLDGNAQRILAAAEHARSQGASLIVTPELALSGYPPEDLVLRGAFNRACSEAVHDLAAKLLGITAVVGYPLQEDRLVFNAAAVLADGKIKHVYRKYRLPNYSVFDEERYFEPRDQPCVFELDGVRIGINICEDVWLPGTASIRYCAIAWRNAGCPLSISTWSVGRMNWCSMARHSL
jgi:NAD+ synthase (glutamine-hydrolysing)